MTHYIPAVFFSLDHILFGGANLYPPEFDTILT